MNPRITSNGKVDSNSRYYKISSIINPLSGLATSENKIYTTSYDFFPIHNYFFARSSNLFNQSQHQNIEIKEKNTVFRFKQKQKNS
jgi:hypothetical protein